VRPDLTAAFRLAFRSLRHNLGSSALCAVAMALPMSALVAAAAVAPGSEPDDGEASGGTGWWTLTLLLLTAQFAGFALLLVGAMVGAAMLVSVRRNERLLALLTAVGASPRMLFLVISAHGILIGIVAAVLAVAIGLCGGAILRGERSGTADAVSVVVIALLTVLVGWVMSLVPAVATNKIEPARALRDAPCAPRSTRELGRAGHRVVLSGLAILAVGWVAGLAGASLREGVAATLLRTAAMMFAAPGAMVILFGTALALPALFRTLGRWASRPGGALRLAARDAERGGTRSMATASSIMAACFLLSSYVSFFGANEVWAKESHQWTLQQNQVAVELIAYSEAGRETTLERDVIDEPATISAAAGIIEETFDTGRPRLIEAAAGPHWGLPIEDNEGFSGAYPVEFPPGGLPHPRLEPDGVCAAAPDEGGPDPTLCTENPYLFELPQLTPTIWAGDAGDLELILGRQPDSKALAALAAGSAIALDPRYLAADDTVTLEWWGEDQFVPEDEAGEFLPAGTPLRTLTLDGVTLAQEHPIDFGIFLGTEAAQSAGLQLVPARILAQSPRWLDHAKTVSAGEALMELRPGLGLVTELGPERPDRTWSWGATGIAGGITLVLAISAIGLSRFEGSRTDATLHALGASPGIRRRINAWYALVVVGLSAVVGTAGGALSIFGTAFAIGASAPQLPLVQLAVMAVITPLLVAAIAWLLPVGARRMPSAD
jgi:hypothetical protein